jgi:hypothetical protein
MSSCRVFLHRPGHQIRRYRYDDDAVQPPSLHCSLGRLQAHNNDKGHEAGNLWVWPQWPRILGFVRARLDRTSREINGCPVNHKAEKQRPVIIIPSSN